MINYGFGDFIKFITNLLGVKTCSACERRRKFLNRYISIRLRTPHEKMYRVQNKLWCAQSMSDNDSAILHYRYKYIIDDFFKEFADTFTKIRNEIGLSFHVLFIQFNTLHCALVPKNQNDKFNLKKSERNKIARKIGKEIIKRTKFRKVKWHVK